MIDVLLRPFVLIALLIRRWRGRRRARALLAEGLPRAAQAIAGALPGPRPSLPIALRIAGALAPPEGSLDFWGLPFGARAIRAPGTTPPRLLRVSILPRVQAPLGRVSLAAFRLDPEGRPSATARAPSRALAAPIVSRTAALAERLGANAALLTPDSARALAIVRARAFALDEFFSPRAVARALPRRSADEFASARSPEPRPVRAVVDLGVARPALFGLDEYGRTEAQREALFTAADRPLPDAPGRLLKPRTPLPRAPVTRLKPKNFRLVTSALLPVNEEMQPPLRDWDVHWVKPLFKFHWHPDHWMSKDHLMFLAPLQLEWFAQWWEAFREKRTGGLPPIKLDIPDELTWALERVKEQMLIRRDVKKDEQPPQEQKWGITLFGPKITYYEGESRDPGALLPEKEYIEVVEVKRWELAPLREAAEAYLQWRTLMDGLVER